jgi:branched-chain amino acid transport system permease protein
MPIALLAQFEASAWQTFLQQCVNGLTIGALFALIALGYTMVYGIIGLINFAHGDLFMLGSFLALALLGSAFQLTSADAGTAMSAIAIAAALAACPMFCAALNVAIDWTIYKPLRNAPKLAPLVSAVGVSFVLMNVGLLWRGPADQNFPDLLPNVNLLGAESPLDLRPVDLLVIGVTVPAMVALTLFVKYTRLGKAMRAVEQNPTAARLMGVHVDRVIAVTFALGGALAGVASVIYGLYVKTVGFQIGFQNGLYAFTAAVLGGIGSIPGAVLGGLAIGLIRSLSDGYLGAQWTPAVIFGILIVVLVFKPTGLLGRPAREKV